MLSLKACSKSFKKTIALNKFSCNFNSGIYGLLGPNGSGKTTLLRCICGLLSVENGNINTDNSVIGYLPQQFGMMQQLTLYEMMQYFATLKNIPKVSRDKEIKKCIEMVNLSNKTDNKISSLSGGMVRRAGIAQAIMGDPKIILFDEPTTGLDPEERMRFKSLIKKIRNDKTIIISTHIVSDVETVCDNIVIINKGKNIFQGTGTQVAKIAENKTYLISDNHERSLSDNCYIKDRILKDNNNYLYILSKKPLDNGISISPSIEDGYLCALKNI